LSESAHLYLIARCLVFQSSFIFFTGMLHQNILKEGSQSCVSATLTDFILKFLNVFIF